MQQYSLIGEAVPRVDATEKVTGSANYAADIPIDLHAWALVVRSPHHHARILQIDTTAAQSLPGVLAVITIEDVPGEKIVGDIIPDRPVLASGKVRFLGEPVALVVAETFDAAQAACAAVTVSYKPLPAALDLSSALAANAPVIHQPGNIVDTVQVTCGDLEQGFRFADHTIEAQFSLQRVYQAYLEPEAASVQINPDDSITVWVSSQKPFSDRDTICKVLGLPEEKVHVISAAVGGAFGAKEDSSLNVLAALAAWKTKKSLRLVNSRSESFLAHPRRHPASLRYRAGFREDGRLTALEVHASLDTGAYASYGPAVVQLFTETVPGPYRIPNVQVTSQLVYTNGPICGAFRGFGAPQAAFGIESLMDRIAVQLGISPVEIRRRNIWQPGDHAYTGVIVNQPEALPAILDHADSELARLSSLPAEQGRKAGVGFALGLQTMGLGYRVPDDTSICLEWQPNGRVKVFLGAPDIGQGLATVAAQITAQVLGIPVDQVDITELNTSQVPNSGVTCASRMTYNVGNAILLAADHAVDALLATASEYLGVEKSCLAYSNGRIQRMDTASATAIPLNLLAGKIIAATGSPLQGMATFQFPYSADTPPDLPFGMPHVKFVFGANVVRVEVDEETGQVTPTHVTAIHDLGKIINRAGVEGQITGGVLQGLGYAFSEDMCLAAPERWVDRFSEYLIPTIVDTPPEMKMILLEFPEQSGPFGAKGIGEIAIVPTAPASASAVLSACGISPTRLPITPQDLFKVS
jgi:CO/xanthine dehydrogenase Mo-binding subunit